MGLRAMLGQGGEPPTLSADTPLRLSLLNLSSLGSLCDLRVFDQEAEIAAFNSSAAELRVMATSSRSDAGEQEPQPGTPAANLKSVALAVEMYAADYDKYPPMKRGVGGGDVRG